MSQTVECFAVKNKLSTSYQQKFYSFLIIFNYARSIFIILSKKFKIRRFILNYLILKNVVHIKFDCDRSKKSLP